MARRDEEGRLYPRTPYTRRQGEVKTVEFWYLRSWMVSDIEFLTKHAKPGSTVVYCVATRILYVRALAEQFFPEVNFIAYCETLEPAVPAIANLDVRNRMLMPAEAKSFRDKDYLLIAHHVVTAGPKGQLGMEMQHNKVRQRQWLGRRACFLWLYLYFFYCVLCVCSSFVSFARALCILFALCVVFNRKRHVTSAET